MGQGSIYTTMRILEISLEISIIIMYNNNIREISRSPAHTHKMKMWSPKAIDIKSIPNR